MMEVRLNMDIDFLIICRMLLIMRVFGVLQLYHWLITFVPFLPM